MRNVCASRMLIDLPPPSDPRGVLTAEAFESPTCSAVVLAADLTGQDTESADAMRQAVAGLIPVPGKNVLIDANPTHGDLCARADGAKLGGGLDVFSDAEEAHVHRLPHNFASVTMRAWNARRPARKVEFL